MTPQKEQVSILDANNLILGRTASIVAKRLLKGERITILNAEKAVVSGRRLSIVKQAKEKLEIGHPRKGPFFPRRPDRYVKRTIRGMLPRQKNKGKEAYKRLRVFVGIPSSYNEKNLETIREARAEKLKCPYITVADLVKEIGWSQTGE
ncbi:MAG: 50S ribosomal protein L13 [Candidatus Bathyarchaeota archaeon]|nr:MAG: 50S ribosomal protein L13 [Candidatus Bathyarchaeota archaeon]